MTSTQPLPADRCFPYAERRWQVADLIETYARLLAENAAVLRYPADAKYQPPHDFVDYYADRLKALQELFGFALTQSHEYEDGRVLYLGTVRDFEHIVEHYNRVRQDIFGWTMVGSLSGIEMSHSRELYQLQNAHAAHLMTIMEEILRKEFPDQAYRSFTDDELTAAGLDPRTQLEPNPRAHHYF